jgi:hypothetical protein
MPLTQNQMKPTPGNDQSNPVAASTVKIFPIMPILKLVGSNKVQLVRVPDFFG